MQFLPSAPELLDAIAAMLERDVRPQLQGSTALDIRVAVSLLSIMSREIAAAPADRKFEEQTYTMLLGTDDADPTTLSRYLRSNACEAFDRASWHALVEIARRDVVVAKPGYEHWTGP